MPPYRWPEIWTSSKRFFAEVSDLVRPFWITHTLLGLYLQNEIEVDALDIFGQIRIEAIDTLAERYLSRGKTMHLRHLSKECTLLLTKAGSLVEINVIEDPDYHIATDKLA